MVKGEVGDRIAPGKDKLIEWYAQSELGNFKGEVTVEIRLFESEASYYILNPYSKTSIKRSAKLKINWSGGLPEDKLEIDLYSSGVRLRSLGTNVDNTGDFEWQIPEDIKPGGAYQIKLQNSQDQNISAFSGNFSIKRKVGLGYKIVPFVLIGAVVGYLLSTGPDPVQEDLPVPDPLPEN